MGRSVQETKMSADDVIYICIAIFSIALLVFIMFFAMDGVYTLMKTSPAMSSNTQVVSMFNAQQSKVLPLFDYLVFGVFMAMVLLLIITGWFIGGNPIFMFIYFLFVVVASFIAAILSNIWVAITTQGAWASVLLHFPITNFLLMHFVTFVGVVGVIGLIVMFAKPFISGGME